MSIEELGRNLLEELDLHILRDLFCPPDCQRCLQEIDHVGELGFYIGWPQELGAGIIGGSADAPMFCTSSEAYSWAGQHEVDLRIQFPSEAES